MELVFGMTVGILKPTCIKANIKQVVPQSVLCIGVLCSCCVVLSFILLVSMTFHLLDTMTLKFRSFSFSSESIRLSIQAMSHCNYERSTSSNVCFCCCIVLVHC